jgi:hypothetical protein
MSEQLEAISARTIASDFPQLRRPIRRCETRRSSEVHVSNLIWTGDLDAIEVVALARLAANPDAAPPTHVSTSLQHKGWLLSEGGRLLPSSHARSLIARLVATGSRISSLSA